jgi:uncharacterized membrane protein YhaH (DUF805 family)
LRPPSLLSSFGAARHLPRPPSWRAKAPLRRDGGRRGRKTFDSRAAPEAAFSHGGVLRCARQISFLAPIFSLLISIAGGLMSFADAIRTCFSKYVMFSGRASRSEFWLSYLFYFLVGAAARVLDAALFPRGVRPFDGIVFIVFILPILAVTARRLHDVDRRGWWMLLPLPFMFVGGVFAVVGLFSGATAGTIIGAASIVIGFAMMILLIVWYCTKGTAGSNRFGADPLAGAIPQTA